MQHYGIAFYCLSSCILAYGARMVVALRIKAQCIISSCNSTYRQQNFEYKCPLIVDTGGMQTSKRENWVRVIVAIGIDNNNISITQESISITDIIYNQLYDKYGRFF